jgi:hypothetical protein
MLQVGATGIEEEEEVEEEEESLYIAILRQIYECD